MALAFRSADFHQFIGGHYYALSAVGCAALYFVNGLLGGSEAVIHSLKSLRKSLHSFYYDVGGIKYFLMIFYLLHLLPARFQHS